MTNEEIWDLLPKQYQEKLESLMAKDEFVESIQSDLKVYSNGEEVYRKHVKYEHKNFAAFMNSAFTWKSSPKKFKWWYKTVFGYEFIHPTGIKDDGSNGHLITEMISDSIEKYKESDGFSYKREQYERDSAQYEAKELRDYVERANRSAYIDVCEDRPNTRAWSENNDYDSWVDNARE